MLCDYCEYTKFSQDVIKKYGNILAFHENNFQSKGMKNFVWHKKPDIINHDALFSLLWFSTHN